MRSPFMEAFQTCRRFFIKHYFLLAIIGITAIAIFFRFYNYPNRWGLGSDQARDAIIIKRSVLNHMFPLIGPFSASGPFVFGSTWYLIFIGLTYFFPHWLLAPWVVQSILFVVIVPVMVGIGTISGGKKLGLLLGFFTAVSTAQVIASTNLIFSSMEIVVSTFVLLFFVLAIEKGYRWSFFSLGLSIGVAISMHFEALPLLILFPLLFLFKRLQIEDLIVLIVGFLLPFIPLGIFNVTDHSYESTHVFDYFFSHSNNPKIPTRWLTYALVSWPQIWGDIIGGYSVLGYLGMGLTVLVSGFAIKQRLIKKPLGISLIIVLSVFILLRYFNGVLFESFLSFLQPFILFITGWTGYLLYRYNRVGGIVAISIFIIGSFIASFILITSATNQTATETKALQSYLTLVYPKQKFAIYDYHHQNESISLPLVLFLYNDKEANPAGKSIGIAQMQIPNEQILYEIKRPYHIFLYKFPPGKHPDEQDWVLVNSGALYASVEDWYK